MLIFGLTVGSIYLGWWLAMWTGVTKLWSWPWRFGFLDKTKKEQADKERFIEETVKRMEVDPRAVGAIYAQSQYHATNPSLVVAILALLLSAMAYVNSVQPEGEWKTVAQGTGVILGIATLWVVVDGFRAMHRVATRSHLYSEVIDRYCERIGLPKRP